MQNANTELPKTGFIRLSTVLQLIPIGKSSWWEGVKNGQYPQPVRIGKRVTAWRAEDIKTLIESFPDRK